MSAMKTLTKWIMGRSRYPESQRVTGSELENGPKPMLS